MDRDIQQRIQRVKLYEQSGHAGFACRRCGIYRPTLRKWWRRYQLNGVEGLNSQSRRLINRPHSAHNGKSPMEKYFELSNDTPYSDEVAVDYGPENERIQDANHKVDLQLIKLKRCL